MQIEKVAKDVIQLLESQPRQQGEIKLLSIKVSLPLGCDAEEVAKYIVANYPQYKAHSKDGGNGQILAVGYR